jgi:glycerol-3-phosphate dehydrogenase
MKTVIIQIFYFSNGDSILQRGEFQLRGRKAERVAYDWLKQIKREMPYYEGIEKVICDGVDLTELVKKLDEAPLE